MLQSNSNFNGMMNGNMNNTSTSSQGPHTNVITTIQVKSRTDTFCNEISTSGKRCEMNWLFVGLDGRIVVWNMEMILKKMNLL